MTLTPALPLPNPNPNPLITPHKTRSRSMILGLESESAVLLFKITGRSWNAENEDSASLINIKTDFTVQHRTDLAINTVRFLAGSSTNSLRRPRPEITAQTRLCRRRRRERGRSVGTSEYSRRFRSVDVRTGS